MASPIIIFGGWGAPGGWNDGWTGTSSPPEGGGGNLPDWVPANAKIYIDLVGNRAWTEVDGVVAIDTLLGSDPNTEGYYGASEYNPARLTADGYVVTTVYNIAFIGAAKAKVLSTFTANFKCKNVSNATATTSLMALASTDGNSALNVDVEGGSRQSWASGNITSASIDGVVNVSVGAFNAVAWTLSGTRLDWACNGSNASSITLVSGDILVASPFSTGLMVLTPPLALQSITLYDPLPDTTGLSELSQTS